jgi:hypothetical protein
MVEIQQNYSKHVPSTWESLYAISVIRQWKREPSQNDVSIQKLDMYVKRVKYLAYITAGQFQYWHNFLNKGVIVFETPPEFSQNDTLSLESLSVVENLYNL